MTGPGLDSDRAVDAVNEVLLGRPGTVIAVFLLVTAGFVGGFGLIDVEQEATDSFIEDVPEQQAFEAIQEEFGDPFAPSTETSQVLHSSDNVLSKPELVRILTLFERAEARSDLRVTSAVGPATVIAQSLDPSAETPAQQRRAVERATTAEIRIAVRENAENPILENTLSDDFNPVAASASGSVSVIAHEFPREGAESEDVQAIQQELQTLADAGGGDVRIFGSGVIFAEFGNIIGDSLAIVIPAVLLLVLVFLIFAYRDPFDLVLGLTALFMTVIWTFGFIGYAGIPFDQQLIAVPVLLLAVGIDFGIHIVNRYREERGEMDMIAAMSTANRQLVVAFTIVTVTTVIGFGANVTSDLEPTRNFGIVSSVGIVFTLLIFGGFLPAAKLYVDRQRERLGIPTFGTKPIATETSVLGRLLPASAIVTRRAPVVFVLLFLVVTAGAVGYGQDVDRTFDTDDFLPPEEIPAYIQNLPEPFAPGEYTVTRNINFLQENFAASQEDSVTMYVVGPFEDDHALESIHRTHENPPDTFVTVDRRADTESIITVIQQYARMDPEFGELVARNDRNGNGVPDSNLDRIYDELFASPMGDQARQYLTEDRRATKIEYTVDADATQREITDDARDYTEQFRYTATATGGIVVFEAVSEIIFDSAIFSLALAIGLTAVFLVVVYWVLERRPLLGLVNLFPILVTVATLVGTMRLLGLPLNALTATILSITIGVGIAYSVHVTHRFIDEYTTRHDAYASLVVTLRGTGGALTGSMLTTAIGTGSLVLAITPVLGDFGLLMAISVFYSYLTAIVVLPPTIYLWARLDRRRRGDENPPASNPS